MAAVGKECASEDGASVKQDTLDQAVTLQSSCARTTVVATVRVFLVDVTAIRDGQV